MGPLLSFFQSFNWAAPSWDLFIFLFFAIGALLYGLSLGRERVIIVLVAMYMSLAVVSNAPILAFLNAQAQTNQNYAVKVGFFLGVFVLLFFLLYRSALLKTFGGSGGPGSWWQTIVFSILQIGLLISITLNLLPKELTQGLSEMTRLIFLSDNARSIWLIAPIALMAVAPKSGEEHSL